jgi:hypothetical protein
LMASGQITLRKVDGGRPFISPLPSNYLIRPLKPVT